MLPPISSARNYTDEERKDNAGVSFNPVADDDENRVATFEASKDERPETHRSSANFGIDTDRKNPILEKDEAQLNGSSIHDVMHRYKDDERNPNQSLDLKEKTTQVKDRHDDHKPKGKSRNKVMRDREEVTEENNGSLEIAPSTGRMQSS